MVLQNESTKSNRQESDLLKRRGTFTVTRALIETEPEGTAEALSGVLIVQLENIFMTNSIKYGGYSKHFDLLKVGEDTPNYIPECKKSESGTITVTWHREKEYTERDVKVILEEIKGGMDINKIANALVSKLNSASLMMGGKYNEL